MKSKDEILEEVVDGIVQFKVIPFIGAGLSTGFGLKDWNALVADLKTELTTTSTDNLVIAQEYEDKLGRDRLIEKLKEYYTIDNIYQYDTSLHQLLLAMNPPVIYTTNYDEAIELIAAGIKKVYVKIATLKNIVDAPYGSHLIIKFHGDFSAPEEIVLTENDYDKRLKLEKPLDIQFRYNVLGRSLLFLGYSLRDKNVNLVLNKHATQYGAANLPQSYLITFDKYVTDDWTNDLESKNVKIISVASPKELFELIKQLNKEVYLNFVRQEMCSLFEPRPSEVLLKSDFDNLKDYWEDPAHSDESKAKAIVDTILRKRIDRHLEEALVSLLKAIIKSNNHIKSKESVITVFRWLGLSQQQYIDLAFDFMELTSYDELNWGNTPSPSMIDVVSTMEMTLGREFTTMAIYMYFMKCHEEKRTLTFEQADRLFYWLKHLRYKEFSDSWPEVLPKELQTQLIEHFLQQHPAVLRNRFNFPSVFLKMTGSETVEYFSKLMPKKPGRH